MVAAALGVELRETVPHGAAGHDTVQLTPLFAESLKTLTVNCAVAPTCTVAVPGETETLITGITVVEVVRVAVVPPPQPEILHVTRADNIAASEMRFFEIIASLTFGLAGIAQGADLRWYNS